MGIKINSYTGSATSYVIPTTRDGVRVIDIGLYCFESTTAISITGDSILNIGSSAFALRDVYIASLANISFPNCSYIGDGAFYACNYLGEASFPNCSYIGDGAFGSCFGLSSVSFPKCSYIGQRAFWGAPFVTNQFSTSSIARLVNEHNNFIISADRSLISGNINDSDTTFICNAAFNVCSSLTTISFPNCRYIATEGFYGCSSLTTISFPNCSYMGWAAFLNCESLATAYFLSTSMTLLYNSNVLSNCTALTSIYVPSSLVDTYKTDTKWSWYSNKIVGM